MSTIAQVIKEKRKTHKMTQQDLSDKSGIGLRLVREIEQGKTSMRVDKVNQVLALFGMELAPTRKPKLNESQLSFLPPGMLFTYAQ